MTAANLRRIVWLIGAGMVFTLISLAFLHLTPTTWAGVAGRVLWIDLASAVVAVILSRLALRWPVRSRTRSGLVAVVVVAFLAYMDVYYFVLLISGMPNPNYVLGVVITAALFLFRPAFSLLLFTVNHAAYCLALFTFARQSPALPLNLIESTLGAVMGALIALLLFRARRGEYMQRQLLGIANARLAERNAELNDLMAITAHDLRSPLLGLRDLLALARRPATDPPHREKILAEAGKSCSQMVDLVGRLLDAHRAEQQPILELRRTDLRVHVEAAVERARLNFPASDRLIRSCLPPREALVAIYPDALVQVLDNLLANALRFAPPKSTILAQVYPEKEEWLCDIIDTGPGVSPIDRERIFQKFYRGRIQSPETAGGSGLGLFIAAEFMKAMNGTLEYVEKESGGAIFRLHFLAESIGR